MSRFTKTRMEIDWKFGGQEGVEREVLVHDYTAMGYAIEALEAQAKRQSDFSDRLQERIDRLAHGLALMEARLASADKPEPLVDGEYVVTLKPDGVRQVARITDGRWFEDCGLAADGRRVWIASGAPHWIGPRIDKEG